jgi:colanic acid/amylovoran biosynthesis glycosyltransferase
MYDHLREVPRYRPLVLAGRIENRTEFPDLEVWPWNPQTLPRRIWRRATGHRPWPLDLERLRRRRPVLLHSHFGWVATGDHALRDAMGLPWIVGIYGADAYELPRDPGWRPRLDRIFGEANLILPLGPAMASRLEALGCAPEKLVVHNLGVDLEGLPFQERVRARGEPLRILFAGTFREKKGVPDLIEAIHLMRRDKVPVHLDLVGDAASKPGDAEMKEEILARIRRWDLEDVVTRHPFLPFAELVALARNCHVLATPSVTAASGDAEGTVFIIQQMMATGMPVVATRHADIPYTFGDLAGALVPERDPPALAAALRRYVDDPDALADDGARFRRHAEANLDIRAAAEALARIYDRAVDQRRG